MKKQVLLSTILICFFSIIEAQIVTTFAGSGVPGDVDSNGTNASFDQPNGVVGDALGNLYVADYDNNKIRKITPSTDVSTFAGSGNQGSMDGIGTAASFYQPTAICLGAQGNFYVADFSNHKIRKITPSGEVTTFAGSGVIGANDGNGTSASFHYPADLVADSSGNIYVVDKENNKVRKITPSGDVSTFAGSGSQGSTDGIGVAASFNKPSGICIDDSGNFYISDQYNQKIRKITSTGMVSTYAGSGAQGAEDGDASIASFNYPSGICVDALGNVFVADFSNNKIRKITLQGVVSTYAGSGDQGSMDGIGAAASFYSPTGIYVDDLGILYVGDQFNHKIRKISPEIAGISENYLDKSLVIYPNPTDHLIHINFLFDSQGASYMVTDVSGKQVMDGELSNKLTSLDFSNFSKGIYFIEVTVNQTKATKKIVLK
jgi:streptogramin lyase